MEKVNLFGPGFVGKRYIELTGPDNVIVNGRDDHEVKTNNVLYFISTVDNYNVFTDPFLDINTNLIVLIKTLETCKNNPNIVFNFISSWFVYGDVDLPAKEDSHCDPKGFYSITKRTAEQLLISYCETFDIKYRILRLGNVLGETDNKVSKKKNALQYMINELKLGNTVKLYDGGDCYRDYIYVDDVVSAINIVLENGRMNEIYNIGNGIPVSIGSVINYAHKKLNSSSIIESIPTVDFHKKVQTTNMVLDISKIKSLGYKQQYSVYDVVDKLIAL